MYLQTVEKCLPTMCLDIIEGSVSEIVESDTSFGRPDHATNSLVLVVCNFILQACNQRAIAENLPGSVGAELLVRIKACLEVKSANQCRVKSRCENKFAALAHASVVFFRAVPKCRPLVLRNGLVGMISHCLSGERLRKDIKSGEPMVWPSWISPALLLLDVMAQPTSVSLVELNEGEVGGTAKSNKKTEYGRVLAEHEKAKQRIAKVCVAGYVHYSVGNLALIDAR